MNRQDTIRVHHGRLLVGNHELEIRRLLLDGVASVRRVMRPWSDTKITHYTIKEPDGQLHVRKIERNGETWFEEVIESERLP